MAQQGQRVTVKGREGAGVVLLTEFDGSRSKQEALIRWDDGTEGWEMGEDCRRLPNVTGDAFISQGNGFGRRAVEVEGVDVIKAMREAKAKRSFEDVDFAVTLGVIPKVRGPRTVPRDRQVTLDIRKAIAHGTPIKGGSKGRGADPRRVKLARAAATGEPLLVRKGPLRKACTIKPFETPTGWAARVTHKRLKGRVRRHSKW